MALNGASIPIGATFAPTGGSATSFLSLGGNGTPRFLLDDSADYAVRRVLTATITEPQSNSGYPGGFTPAKRRLALTAPRVLADGSVFTDQVIVEMIVHPETSDADITALRSDIVNIVNDADFDSLWEDGSTA
jgi:hypothetical protein